MKKFFKNLTSDRAIKIIGDIALLMLLLVMILDSIYHFMPW